MCLDIQSRRSSFAAPFLTSAFANNLSYCWICQKSAPAAGFAKSQNRERCGDQAEFKNCLLFRWWFSDNDGQIRPKVSSKCSLWFVLFQITYFMKSAHHLFSALKGEVKLRDVSDISLASLADGRTFISRSLVLALTLALSLSVVLVHLCQTPSLYTQPPSHFSRFAAHFLARTPFRFLSLSTSANFRPSPGKSNQYSG